MVGQQIYVGQSSRRSKWVVGEDSIGPNPPHGSLGATRRTENGHDLRKEIVRVISTMPQVIHEGDAVIPLLVGVLEEEVGEPLQVDVVLEQRRYKK
jgi:hypothetical protein